MHRGGAGLDDVKSILKVADSSLRSRIAHDGTAHIDKNKPVTSVAENLFIARVLLFSPGDEGHPGVFVT